MYLHRAMRYYRIWIYSCNLALLLSVLIFVALAAWVLSDFHMALFPTIHFHQPTFVYSYLALILQGGILQAIGCLGALRMNERLLNAYWTIMLVLLMGDVVVGVVWLFRYNQLTGQLGPELKHRLQTQYGSDARFQLLWDRVQTESRCCGVHGPTDFNSTLWMVHQRQLYPHRRQVLPRSCCKMAWDTAVDEEVPVNRSCIEGGYHGELVHQRGCLEAVHRWLQRSADMLSVLGFCVIAFLKVCFLGILRYEIREMIQKIKVLRDMNEQACPLTEIGGSSSPHPGKPLTNHVNNNTVLSFSSETLGHNNRHERVKSPNGNNNESVDRVRKTSNPV